MERLDTGLENYQKSIQSLPTTETIEEYDEWKGTPYRPRKDCPACNGFGFVMARDSQDKIMPCAAAGCLLESVRKSIGGEEAIQTFDNFKPVDGAARALKYARQIASLESNFKWLAIYGPTGSGKSHLGNAIARQVRETGADVRVVLAADFFSLLKEGISDNLTEGIMRRFKDLDFLVIDDYGVEYGTPWEKAKFDELMTARYAHHRHTVLITNADLEDIPERVLSRFNDRALSRVAQNSAPDYRKTKR